MKTKEKAKCWLALLGISGALIAGISTWVKFSNTRNINTQCAALDERNGSLKKQQHFTEAQSNLANLAAEKMREAEAQKRREQMKNARTAAIEKERAWQDFLAKNPTLKNKQLSVYHAGVAATYGPFFHKTHLSPEKIAKLKEALVQRQLDKDALKEVAGTLRTYDSVNAKAYQEVDEAFLNTAHADLSDEEFSELERYERDIKRWSYAGEFAAHAAMCGMPINLQQAEQLVDAFENVASDPGDLPRGIEQWRYVEEQAKGFLNPEQLEMFRSIKISIGEGRDEFNYEFERALADYAKRKPEWRKE